MKNILKFIIQISIFLLGFQITNAQNDSLNLNKIRNLFYQAVQNENKLATLKNEIKSAFGEKKEKYPPIGLAYFGASLTLEAKHSFNPINKINSLREGLKILDKSVKLETNNLEIRFLRFSVLHHLPDILGYGTEKVDDVETIYKLLLKQDYINLPFEIQKGIANFLIKSKRISKEQIISLNLIFNK